MEYSSEGLAAARDVALGHAVGLLRDASDDGRSVADKASVTRAASALRASQTGGRTVMRMSYVDSSRAALGRGPRVCQTGGADLAQLRAALSAEGIRATPSAVTEAVDESAEFLRGSVEPLLRLDHPHRRWTAPLVVSAAQRGPRQMRSIAST